MDKLLNTLEKPPEIQPEASGVDWAAMAQQWLQNKNAPPQPTPLAQAGPMGYPPVPPAHPGYPPDHSGYPPEHQGYPPERPGYPPGPSQFSYEQQYRPPFPPQRQFFNGPPNFRPQPPFFQNRPPRPRFPAYPANPGYPQRQDYGNAYEEDLEEPDYGNLFPHKSEFGACPPAFQQKSEYGGPTYQKGPDFGDKRGPNVPINPEFGACPPAFKQNSGFGGPTYQKGPDFASRQSGFPPRTEFDSCPPNFQQQQGVYPNRMPPNAPEVPPKPLFQSHAQPVPPPVNPVLAPSQFSQFESFGDDVEDGAMAHWMDDTNNDPSHWQNKKKLPQWLLEGLKKSEEEKQKQAEKAKQAKEEGDKEAEREERRKRKGKSRFDSDSEDEETSKPLESRPAFAPNALITTKINITEEELDRIQTGSVKSLMIQVLLEATDIAIKDQLQNAWRYLKGGAKPKLSGGNAALGALTSLAQYSDDEDESESGECTTIQETVKSDSEKGEKDKSKSLVDKYHSSNTTESDRKRRRNGSEGSEGNRRKSKKRKRSRSRSGSRESHSRRHSTSSSSSKHRKFSEEHRRRSRSRSRESDRHRRRHSPSESRRHRRR